MGGVNKLNLYGLLSKTGVGFTDRGLNVPTTEGVIIVGDGFTGGAGIKVGVNIGGFLKLSLLTGPCNAPLFKERKGILGGEGGISEGLTSNTGAGLRTANALTSVFNPCGGGILIGAFTFGDNNGCIGPSDGIVFDAKFPAAELRIWSFNNVSLFVRECFFPKVPNGPHFSFIYVHGRNCIRFKATSKFLDTRMPSKRGLQTTILHN